MSRRCCATRSTVRRAATFPSSLSLSCPSSRSLTQEIFTGSPSMNVRDSLNAAARQSRALSSSTSQRPNGNACQTPRLRFTGAATTLTTRQPILARTSRTVVGVAVAVRPSKRRRSSGAPFVIATNQHLLMSSDGRHHRNKSQPDGKFTLWQVSAGAASREQRFRSACQFPPSQPA
jgi:hypothetical protein